MDGREQIQYSCHYPPANKDKGRHLVMLSWLLVVCQGRSATSGRQLAAAVLTRIVVAYPVPNGKQVSERPGRCLCPPYTTAGEQSTPTHHWLRLGGAACGYSIIGIILLAATPSVAACAPTIRVHLPRLQSAEPLSNAWAMLVVCLCGQCWARRALSDREPGRIGAGLSYGASSSHRDLI